MKIFLDARAESRAVVKLLVKGDEGWTLDDRTKMPMTETRVITLHESPHIPGAGASSTLETPINAVP